MPDARRLSVSILSQWICATGRGVGFAYDAACVRDAAGLPYVPGRHLKGLLRDAVERMPSYHVPVGDPIHPEDAVDLLFGAQTEDGAREAMPDGLRFGGCLRIGNATLAPGERDLLLDLPVHRREEVLFMAVHATAITREGIAARGSLRAVQAAIPLDLEARIEFDDATASLAAEDPVFGPVAEHWVAIIERALPLVRAVGAHRHRGYGRAVCRFAA